MTVPTAPPPAAAPAALPLGEPLLVRDVFVGGAITDGPAVMVVLVGDGDGEAWTVSAQWDTLDRAERDLSAALADVRSRMPLPPVAQFPTAVRS